MESSVSDPAEAEVRDVVEMLLGLIEREDPRHRLYRSKERDRSSFGVSSSSSSCSSSSSSSSSTSDDEDETSASSRKKAVLMKRKKNPTTAVADESEEEDEDDEETGRKTGKAAAAGLFAHYTKTKDELTIDELGPIEKLNISLDEQVELVPMGHVLSVVDKLLVVESLLEPPPEPARKPGGPRPTPDGEPQPLDEDTVLFDSTRKPIGKVFEIFGPVYHPFYSVRFNSVEEIQSSGLDLAVGAQVLYAPKSNKFTKFIFNITQLKQLKGSDASWNHDQEPPAECVDYSDDEQERFAKKQLKQSRKGLKTGDDCEDDEETLEEGEEDSETTSNMSERPQQQQNRFNNPRQQHQATKRHHQQQQQQGRPFMPRSNSSYSAQNSGEGFAHSRAYQHGRRSFMPSSSSSQGFGPQSGQPRHQQQHMNKSNSFQPMSQFGGMPQQFQPGGQAQGMYPNWPGQQTGNNMMMQYPNPYQMGSFVPPFMPAGVNMGFNFPGGGQWMMPPGYGAYNAGMFANHQQPQQQQMTGQFGQQPDASRSIVDRRFMKNEGAGPK